jgi:hypothetical protein
MATTTIHIHQIVSVRAEKHRSIEHRSIDRCTWRNIVVTDADGRETTIALFPADGSKPEQISIIDEERPHA